MERPSDNRCTSLINHDNLSALEERLRLVKENDWYNPIRAAEICLVPNIVVLKDFKVPDFVKYTGLECPNTHLRLHYNKMAKVIHNDKMLIYFFQNSLTRSVLSWHMKLDNTRIKKWKDLTDAFLKQYKFNLETTFDRTNLIAMEKGNQESMRVYAQRWQYKATHVQPLLIETEMMMLFTNTFQSPYYEHLMGSLAQYF